MKTGIFIQVSMQSKRCPGKAMADLNGKPLIHRLVERLEVLKLPIILCFRYYEEDQPLTEFADSAGVRFFRGVQDPMTRIISAAGLYEVDQIVRVTGDNPFTCPGGIAKILTVMDMTGCDYVTTVGPRGTKSEIVKTRALKEVRSKLTIEDTELCFSDALNCINDKRSVIIHNEYHHKSVTVDTKEDLKRAQLIYERYENPTVVEALTF